MMMYITLLFLAIDIGFSAISQGYNLVFNSLKSQLYRCTCSDVLDLAEGYQLPKMQKRLHHQK